MDTERLEDRNRGSDVIRKHTKERVLKIRRSTRPENVEIENSMRLPQIGEGERTRIVASDLHLIYQLMMLLLILIKNHCRV